MEYIGIDYGRKNIGLSWGSTDLDLVIPLKPILNFQTFTQAFEHIKTVVEEKGCDAIVIGLPLHMDGNEGKRVNEVKSFAEALRKYTAKNIYFQDERLSTQTARCLTGYQSESMKKSRQRKQRGIIDSQSAMIILQDFIDQLGA